MSRTFTLTFMPPQSNTPLVSVNDLQHQAPSWSQPFKTVTPVGDSDGSHDINQSPQWPAPNSQLQQTERRCSSTESPIRQARRPALVPCRASFTLADAENLGGYRIERPLLPAPDSSLLDRLTSLPSTPDGSANPDNWLAYPPLTPTHFARPSLTSSPTKKRKYADFLADEERRSSITSSAGTDTPHVSEIADIDAEDVNETHMFGYTGFQSDGDEREISPTREMDVECSPKMTVYGRDENGVELMHGGYGWNAWSLGGTPGLGLKW